jgi:PAS domain S-box-containing protein
VIATQFREPVVPDARRLHFIDLLAHLGGDYIERQQAQKERERAENELRDSEERLRFALDAAEAGTWDAIPGTGEFNAFGRAVDLLGLPSGTSLTFETALAALHPLDQPVVEQALRRTFETGTRVHLDVRVPLPDGTMRWLELHAELRAADAKSGLAGLLRDVSERHRASEQVQTLMRELNHRSKNMLALIQAIARQTVASSPADFLERFAERVQALASSQDLLVRRNWKGVELSDLFAPSSRISPI